MVEQEQEQQPIVKMRERNVNAAAHSALARGIEALNEGEVTEETEGQYDVCGMNKPNELFVEIRKLDTQLDHLNDYMTKMEERLKAHNDRMMETLKQQKEEREKRRRSFHEVLKSPAQYKNFKNLNQLKLVKVTFFPTNKSEKRNCVEGTYLRSMGK